MNATDSPDMPGRCLPLTADDPVRVGPYRLTAKLGSGGMGQVFLSYTPGGRPVAVKVIRPELSGDPEFRRRFRQEVRAAEQVHGLFTAPVVDSDTEAEAPWLCTAYVAGPSLADAVARHGALPDASSLLLVAGIAEALQSIHRAGIVHRDLKPSNVLLTADGPRVIDFGIARAADATTLTVAGLVVGTPSFMSPEQAMGGEVGPATDVFTLGQVAAYASTGASAFGEGSGPAVLYRVVHELPDVDGVPAPLRGVVSRCLAKRPADRPSLDQVIAACREAAGTPELRRAEDWLPAAVAGDLDRASRGVPSGSGAVASAAPEQLVQVAPPAPEPAAQAADTAPAPSRGALHLRLWTSLAVASAVTLAGAGGYLLAPGTDGQDASTAQHGPEEGRARATPEPAPTVYENVELPDSYHLFLRDTPVKPTRSGSWNQDEIDFRYHADRLRTREGNRLAVLPASAKGTLDACREQTRFTKNIEADGVRKGARICLFTVDGHAALVTLRDVQPSEQLGLTVTTWRDAVPEE